MARTRVEEANTGDGTSGGEGEGDLRKPEKLTKKQRAEPLEDGKRRCRTKATLRFADERGDVPHDAEIVLSAEEFKHFAATGCVEEIL